MPLRANIVNGETVLRRVDLRLPGYVPIVLARIYRSGREQSGAFGHGWRLNWALTLRVEPEEIIYAPSTPHEIRFISPDEGMQARHANGALIQNAPDAYTVVPFPSRRFVFEKGDAREGEIPLTRIEDPNGNGVHFFYDRERLVGLVDTMGREVRMEYQGGQVNRLYLESGDASVSTIRTYQYNSRGDLVAERDAEGADASYRYRHHLMTEHTLRNGGTQYAQYDGDRRCRALWYADGSEVRRFFYDPSRQRTRVVEGGGRQTLYQHVQPGRVLERTDPVDRTQNYYYDDALRLVGFSDVHGVVQTFQQLDLDDGTGTFLDGEERSATLAVDEDLRVTAVLDPLENRYSLAYGDHGRVTHFQTPSGRDWTFQRDERGGVAKVNGPCGESVRITRAADGRTLEVEDDHGRRTEEHFDDFGRLVERIDPLQRRFQWLYDANGRLRGVRAGGESMEFEYSPGGAPTRIVDAADRVTELRRDAFGRLQECIFGNEQYHLDYDASGRIRSVTGPEGERTSLAYGEGGRLTNIDYGTGRTVAYDRGEEGTRVWSEGSDGTTQVVYNQSGAPVRWKQPGRKERVLDYGPAGELFSVEWGDQSLFFDYNEDRCVVGASEGGDTVRITYGGHGEIQAVYRGGDEVLESTRDALGRPSELRMPLQAFGLEYDEGDRLTEIQVETDSWSFEYSAFGRPEVVHAPPDPPEKTSGPDDVETYILESSNSAVDQQNGGELILHAARRGIALSLHTDSWCIPLWRQGDCLRPETSFSPVLVAATLTLGDEPLIAPIRSFFAPRLPRRWRELTERGIRWDHAEVPQSAMLGNAGWSALGRFFLDRSFYEMGHRSLGPAEGAGTSQRDERSPDSWVTGPHFTGELRPPVWSHGATGSHLRHRALGPGRVPTSPIDVLELIRQ